MTRRLLATTLIAPAAFAKKGLQEHKEEKIPTDNDTMNSFADLYNEYVTKLKNGQIDVSLWKKVMRRWHSMVD